MTQINDPTLYIFAGLPGTGKSTIAEAVASRINAVYIRIDTIEQALRDLCDVDVQGEGYGIAYRIAADNLKAGKGVVADSCNPIALTREAWQDVARGQGVEYRNIEVICSDPVEHRRRVEGRNVNIPGLVLPTWQQVLNREYQEWSVARLVVDTAGRSSKECVDDLLARLDE